MYSLERNALYYVEYEGLYGPFSCSQLRTMGLLPDVWVYSTASNRWAPANSYPELAAYIVPLSPADYEAAPDDGGSSDDSLEADELGKVIEEQEEEIARLKNALSKLLGKQNPDEDEIPDVPVFDIDSIGTVNYSEKATDICAFIAAHIVVIECHDSTYHKVFLSEAAERKYYVDEYVKFIRSVKDTANQVSDKLREIQASFDNDMVLLENSIQEVRDKCSRGCKNEERRLLGDIERQIDSLLDSHSGEMDVEALKKIFENKKNEIITRYKQVQIVGLEKVAQKRREIKDSFESLRQAVMTTIMSRYESGRAYFEDYFNNLNKTSVANSAVCDAIEGSFPAFPIMLGTVSKAYSFLGEEFKVTERRFVGLLNERNLIVRHDNNSRATAHRLVNSLLGRLMASVSPWKVNITMIDADEMSGTCDEFKSINRDLFRVASRTDEIRKYLEEKERDICNIIQNLLVGSVRSLYDYNQIKDAKESYHIIVMKAFPSGLTLESSALLQKILRNGVCAGVGVILLLDEDRINESEDVHKIYCSFNMDSVERMCDICDLTKNAEECINFEVLSDESLRKIVQYVNSCVEIRTDEAIPFTDYLPEKSNWWTRRSSKYVEIPFGVSDDRKVQRLKITQENGQNSAVVIGIPGSGKSVFLHVLICNAALYYSPDELNLYLLDFSGVEFNTYALHNLPHARVIAPEAEREFGLSILNELVEEGSRRMALCRENEVSNIVDLKAKNPALRIPRLLVIIDEFQKLFEIENDAISREANSKIHIIIQEFRKFGINLILATQKLPSSSVLPKDLIANRVVFKSSPADFTTLITVQNNVKIPQLRTGECIYNSESGSPCDNHRTRGFLISQSERDRLLDEISDYAKSVNYTRGGEIIVFRGQDLPEFDSSRFAKEHRTLSEIPSETGIYLGSSIAVSDTDVHAALRNESANNILILGGLSHVAQKIAFFATISATFSHVDNSADFLILNFLRRDDTMNDRLKADFEHLPFHCQMVSKTEEVNEALSAIRDEISARRNDEERCQKRIYLSIFAFQFAHMFDRGGRHGDDVSECGMLLNYILKNGPATGVFTILQCDNWDNLYRIGNVLSFFAYRVALQMTESDSNKIIGSSAASMLHVINRPSSDYRAYFRDNNANVNIKFKPYKWTY